MLTSVIAFPSDAGSVADVGSGVLSAEMTGAVVGATVGAAVGAAVGVDTAADADAVDVSATGRDDGSWLPEHAEKSNAITKTDSKMFFFLHLKVHSFTPFSSIVIKIT